MGYDVIGDLHGHAGALRALLAKLGYQERLGVWRHPTRTAIFVGDFIDRGPEQLETVRIVRAMVEAGTALAVMGNHEYNAIAWNTPREGASADSEVPSDFLRTHTAGHRRQHQAFLDAVAGKDDERKAALEWFWTLPLWLDLPELRVVHACWHARHMAVLRDWLEPGNRLSPRLLVAASQKGSPEYRALEAVLKGPEVSFPAGLELRMGDETRAAARTRWWDANATSLRAAAIVEPEDESSVPSGPEVPPDAHPGYAGSRPVFIGHYWMKGQPALLAPRVACVDYSAGLGYPLVAYRWDGEQDLDPAHFVCSGPACAYCPNESIAA